MESKYAIKVNGQFLTNVVSKPNLSIAEATAFVKTFEPSFDETKDTLEVECLDVQVNTLPIPFRTNPFMQSEILAIEVHIDNLINTFGPDMVLDMVNRKLGRAA